MKAISKITSFPAPAGVPRSFSDLKSQHCVHYGRRACPWTASVPLASGRLPARNSPADYIFIPLEVRGWEIGKFSLPMRLQNILGWRNCRRLGDLHGLRLSDIAHWRNCGRKTLLQLIRFIRNVQEGNWGNWRGPWAGPEDYYQI